MHVGKNLRRVAEQHGFRMAFQNFNEALKKGDINAKRDISIREIAEGMLGHNWYSKLEAYAGQRRVSGVREGRIVSATEGASTEAVDASAFADITGQLLVNEVKQGYESADLVGDELVETIPITNGNLGPQRTPWLSQVVDDASTIQPGMPYPKTQFTQQYIDYPAPEKFGEICAVTMEAIYSDLTSQIYDSANSVGRRVGINREERILKIVLGISNNHSWNGSSYNTYQTSTPWINVKSSNPITDWTHINELEYLFMNMVDPVTGKAIMVKPEWMLVMPYKYYTHKRILTATDVRTGDGASTTMATYAPTPLETNYKLIRSQFAFNLLTLASASGGGGITAANAKEYAYFGSKKAFVWRQAEPMTVVEAPTGNPMEFNQDIALAVKARCWGVAAVRDPRYVVKSYNS